MKKMIIIVALSLFAASSAFAGGAATIAMDANLATGTNNGLSIWASTAAGGATSGTGLISKTSTGVAVAMSTATTGYAVVTQHKKGTKAFGTSFDSTSIYSLAVTTVGTPVTVTLTGNNSAGFSSWTTQ